MFNDQKPVSDLNAKNEDEVNVSFNPMASSQPAVRPRSGRTIPGTEDIFSEAEVRPANQPLPRPVSDVTKQPGMPSLKIKETPAGPPEPLSELPDDLDYEDKGGRKFLWIGLAVVLLIFVVGGYFAYGRFFKGPFVNSSLNNVNFIDNNQQNIEPLFNNQNFNGDTGIGDQNNNFPDGNLNLNSSDLTARETDQQLDSDRDGLTDQQETDLGTDSFEADSDGDNLFDREEVEVYQTDPLNPDTDSDGFLDGSEVKNGYNPKGDGKLLEPNF